MYAKSRVNPRVRVALTDGQVAEGRRCNLVRIGDEDSTSAELYALRA